MTKGVETMKEKIESFFADGNWIEVITPYAVNLVVAILIYVVGKWVAKRILTLIGKMMDSRGMDDALKDFLSSILSVLFSFVVVLVALEQLGVDTTSLLALLGAAGLAVGLALKDSLSNFAAGVMLILFKPFKLGDYVEAGGTAGVIEKISVFNTIMKTPDNKEVIVPNAHIYSGTITNYSAKPTRRVDLVIGIGYDDDMKKARDLIQKVLDADDRILAEPAPVIAVGELGDSSVNFLVRPWVNSADYWGVYWDALENIKETFDQNGISIPFPQRDVHVYQESKD
ncbi:MscS Mechanosensitive ion channel [gamma proteobacterium HTCC5015]|nr:MscS Mechanosensitive ion channel [gamma proteobacterium HTCC5015]